MATTTITGTTTIDQIGLTTMTRRENNFEGSLPLLYLISTPIGNLEEFSPRAKQVLSSCDLVASEDTRNTGKLLSFFNISKPLISCHEHNEEEISEKLIAKIKEGAKVCYCSDAGYPCLSDPGSRLVAKCLENDIKVSVVSGPCAAINALVCSGLDSTHFYFEGFLPAKESEKVAELEDLAKRKETLIFYESPHRIKKTLASLLKGLGDRKMVIARELTKAHEEFIRGNISELNDLSEETLRGEMVLIVEGNRESKEVSDEDIIKALKASTLKGKDAVKDVASKLNVSKNRVYDLYLENKQSF